MKKNVVVLGAGITGLYTAYRLLEKGFDVTVVEKAKVYGGAARSFKYNNFILDIGPHKFYTQLPGITEEYKKVLGKNILEVKKKNSIRMQGKYFEFPVKIPQLILGVNKIVGFRVGFDYGLSILKKPFSKKSLSYEDYFKKGFGNYGYNILFRDYAWKVWGNPKELSEELARKRIPVPSIFQLLLSPLKKKDKSISAEFFYYPKYGFGVLCDEVVKKIGKKKGSIYLNSEIKSINLEDGKIKSVDIKTKGKTINLEADFVVSTIKIDSLMSLLNPKIDQEIINSANALKYRNIIIAYVFINKKQVLKDNWIFFPEKEFIFNRVSEQKSFSKYTCPKNKTVVTAEITADDDSEIFKKSDKAIFEKVITDLDTADLVRREWVYDYFVLKAKSLYPVYAIGYKDNLNKVLNFIDTVPNLITIGRQGLFNYNNTDHCIDMANITADFIKKKKSKSEWKKSREYFDSYKIVD